MTKRLNIDPELTQQLLVRFLENEISKAGFTKGVIGLSSRVDSATSAYLAVSALGAENVIGIRMPYRDSERDTLERYQLVVDELGIHCETIDISASVDSLCELSAGIDDSRRANILARIRMTLLFDRSAAWRGLVIGTSNKSDLLLGYGTIFGDLASAVNPLGDLYETQVLQLAKHIGIPAEIIDKHRSAVPDPGKSDDEELVFDYRVVDSVLHMLVDERYSLRDLLEEGYDKEFLSDVIAKIRGSQYKRTPPIIPKLTGRTVGHDFRYLRDWGM